MDNAARARQRILAVFLPVTAMLYISCEALDPKGTDQVVTSMATAFKVLAIAAAHPTQLYVAGTLSILALGALAASYAAIAALVRDRGWVIATVAALLGGIGAFCGAIINVLVGVNLVAAATAHTPPDAAARFLLTSFNSGAGQIFTYLYFVGEYTAGLGDRFAQEIDQRRQHACVPDTGIGKEKLHHATLGRRPRPCLSGWFEAQGTHETSVISRARLDY